MVVIMALCHKEARTTQWNSSVKEDRSFIVDRSSLSSVSVHTSHIHSLKDATDLELKSWTKRVCIYYRTEWKCDFFQKYTS